MQKLDPRVLSDDHVFKAGKVQSSINFVEILLEEIDLVSHAMKLVVQEVHVQVIVKLDEDVDL